MTTLEPPSPSVLKSLRAAREMTLFAIVLLAGLLLKFASPTFLTAINIDTLLAGVVPEAIIAVSMTILIVSGGFDLSVGSVMALGGVIAGTLLKMEGSIALAALGGLGVGLACGLINGLVITRARVTPLIATLGMMLVARSLALVKTQSIPVSGFPHSFRMLGQGHFLGIPVPILVMAVTVMIGDLLLRHTRYLRQVYYIGGNEKAARLSGIRVDAVRLFGYSLSGVLSAFAGILLASRLASASPTVGSQVELRVIAAVVIGGASLAGGEGTILGAFLGVLLMGLIGNAITLLGISPYWQDTVTGAILVAAVAFDMLTKRRG
ncbi:MAG: ABC transporter permease [Armatimonadetes bacterium]|nr:ABC transporter permease [Armatimonadota bacterium]